DLADKARRQTVRQMRPRLAAVGRLVHTGDVGRTAAQDRPRLALGLPRAGVDLLRVVLVHRQRDGADLVADVEDFLPCAPAVRRAEHAALGVWPERRSGCRDERDVGIARMNLERTDLPRI